ncbi:ATP-dependent nuclease [Ferruginibacter sp.]
MPHIHSLVIKNFRGIRDFEQHFKSDFICLIGRGDSGKSTILDAIAMVLSTNWSTQFFDNDFHNCDISTPIVIEATITDLPDGLIEEEKFGMYLRGIDATGKITEEIEEAEKSAITIRLEVHKDLEPQWNVITEREIGIKKISANDRSKLNAFLVADYAERHFSWTKGSPLYSLLKQESDEEENDDAMINALREAKTKIDASEFNKFDSVIAKVKASAAQFGIDISKVKTTIDFRDIVIKDGKVGLHDQLIPFRLKGKGSKRIISMSIQASIAEVGGIVLIDEIEQGLEADRVQNLIHILKEHNHGQIFITTHSRDVLVEVEAKDIYIARKTSKELFNLSPAIQGSVRRNPEAFFAKKVLIGEGATELGVCRALNNYRVKKGLPNATFRGVRTADGGGDAMIEYAQGFLNAGFPTALFCDSDAPIPHSKKPSLRIAGVKIFDWPDTDSFEMAIFKYLPFPLILEVFELAALIKNEEDHTSTVDQYKTNMWASVTSSFGSGCPGNLAGATDTEPLRLAIAKASTKKDKEWFKRQDKALKTRQYHIRTL